jgi:phenylacetate-CoA ligase
MWGFQLKKNLKCNLRIFLKKRNVVKDDLMLNKALIGARSFAFWGKDFLRGSITRRALKEIESINKLDSENPKVKMHQETALKSLLTLASETTNFYKEFNGFEFNNYPIINKNTIKDKQNDFISNKYSKNSLVTMSTSGSTGTPFVCYQNIDKKRRVTAEVIYYSGKAGYSVGQNLIYLRAITEKSKKSKALQWVQNEALIDISNLDDNRIEKILGEIESASKYGSMMLAYASTYDALKDYINRYGNSKVGKSKISGIVSGSEMLFDETRGLMSKVFNCNCYSRYSNQENGIIGQDDSENNNVFLLNEADYIIEILKVDADETVINGEIGRIVITDLYNYAMPMVRYDTGDIGSITYVEKNGIRKRAITNFGGRKVDVVFDCYGNRLSPHSITNKFWSFPEIQQYQFIQETEKEYTVKINVNEKFNREQELKDELFKLLGFEASIVISHVKEIPITASGKRKYIINNYQ